MQVRSGEDILAYCSIFGSAWLIRCSWLAYDCGVHVLVLDVSGKMNVGKEKERSPQRKVSVKKEGA